MAGRDRLTLVVLALLALGMVSAIPAAGRQTSTLTLRAVFETTVAEADCPPETPAGRPGEVICLRMGGSAPVSGLGEVAQSHPFVRIENAAGCPPAASHRVPGFSARFEVATKGSIDLVVPMPVPCISFDEVLRLSRPFSVSGGSGAYSGASGAGTLRVVFAPGAVGTSNVTHTWEVTLTVSNLDFDVNRPTLAGATSRVVRVRKGVRSVPVTFRVTARDDRDGARPVACKPRPGSRVRLGRTRVTCSATDASGNVAQATFAITVRVRR
jgi:hypothetical protein